MAAGGTIACAHLLEDGDWHVNSKLLCCHCFKLIKAASTSWLHGLASVLLIKAQQLVYLLTQADTLLSRSVNYYAEHG